MTAVLLDTCVILHMALGKLLTQAAQDAIGRARSSNAVGLSVVTAWELGLASSPLRKHPMLLRPTPKAFTRDAFAQPGITTVELTADIAFEASHLPDLDHKDPGDRLLIATARSLDIPLVTDDRKILDYAHRGHMKAIAC